MPPQASIRLMQIAAVAQGTLLAIAGLMLLAAASGPRPLLSEGAAQLGVGVSVAIGCGLMAVSFCLGRRPEAGRKTLLALGLVAVATSIVLYFPVLIGLGVGTSGGIAILAWRGGSPSPYETPRPTRHVSVPTRLAQAASALHGTCLLLAVGALLGATGGRNPLVPASDAVTDAYLNGPLGLMLLTGACYCQRSGKTGQ